jgi:hypothetical protein
MASKDRPKCSQPLQILSAVGELIFSKLFYWTFCENSRQKFDYILFLEKFASPEGRIYFHQSIQYSYKVCKYCIHSSSPERVGIYFSGLQFHPWIDLLPTTGLDYLHT